MRNPGLVSVGHTCDSVKKIAKQRKLGELLGSLFIAAAVPYAACTICNSETVQYCSVFTIASLQNGGWVAIGRRSFLVGKTGAV